MKKVFRTIPVAQDAEQIRSYPDFFGRLPILSTPDLTLRPFRRKDAQDVFAYSSDPEVARYVLWTAHQSISESKYYLRCMKQLYRRGLPSSWAIELKQTGRVIGSVGFMWVSLENRSAEIGYSLSRSYWNRGLMTQAVSSVIGTAFSCLLLNRIEAQIDIRNPASGRVLEKCGMMKEGILRSRIFNKGEYVDVVLYSVLRTDRPVWNPAASE